MAKTGKGHRNAVNDTFSKLTKMCQANYRILAKFKLMKIG